MKLLLLSILIIANFSVSAAPPAKLLPGYIVTANHDTIQCKIKGGRFLSTPFRGITIENEQGEAEFLPSRDKKIIAFGFVEYLVSYHYRFIEVGDRLENGFYQLIVNGERYKLYARATTVAGGLPTYVLVNNVQAVTSFEPCLICPWKKRLRQFLKDDPKALEHVENASRVDIPKFALEINKL